MTLPSFDKLCEFDQITGEALVLSMLRFPCGARKVTFMGGLPHGGRVKQHAFDFEKTLVTQDTLLDAVDKLYSHIGRPATLEWYALPAFNPQLTGVAQTLFIGPFRLMWGYVITTDSIMTRLELACGPA